VIGILFGRGVILILFRRDIVSGVILFVLIVLKVVDDV
jgi:hypothetical protein